MQEMQAQYAEFVTMKYFNANHVYGGASITADIFKLVYRGTENYISFIGETIVGARELMVEPRSVNLGLNCVKTYEGHRWPEHLVIAFSNVLQDPDMRFVGDWTYKEVFDCDCPKCTAWLELPSAIREYYASCRKCPSFPLHSPKYMEQEPPSFLMPQRVNGGWRVPVGPFSYFDLGDGLDAMEELQNSWKNTYQEGRLEGQVIEDNQPTDKIISIA